MVTTDTFEIQRADGVAASPKAAGYERGVCASLWIPYCGKTKARQACYEEKPDARVQYDEPHAA